MTATAGTSERPAPVVPQDIIDRRRHGASVPTRRRTGRAGHLVVACILDEFSFAAFSGEADLAPLTMKNWQVDLTAAQPDLLLVESAWRGHRQKWWNTVHHHGPELTGIVQWCKDRGIPTAFWNKEDPVHFNTFLTTAGMFDAVFTTDLDCVPLYKRELGHDNVHFLPFAAQTAESNPLEVFDRVEGCAFAGAYYEKYPARLADLAELSAELSADGRRFDIYDRNHGSDMPGYMFPKEYQPYIVGGALTPDMLDIPYKGYTANLNLNSVKQSQSMFARRVFELMASNTLVISNFSRGLRLMFGDLAITTDSGTEVRRRLAALTNQPNGVARLRAMALRKVLREHTYAERLEYIAEQSGAPLPGASVDVPLLLTDATDPSDVQYCIDVLQAQTHPTWTLLHRCPEVTTDDPRVQIAPTSLSPLEYARSAGHSSIGRISATDHYGPHYLEDLLAALRVFDVPAAGHGRGGRQATAEHPNGDPTTENTPAWTLADDLPLRASLIRTPVAHEAHVAPRTGDSDEGLGIDGLSVGHFEYLRGGRSAEPDVRALVEELRIDEGIALHDLRAWADDLTLPADTSHLLPATAPAEILSDLPAKPHLAASHAAEGLTITSTLEAGKHDYWIAPAFHPVSADDHGRVVTMHVDATPGLTLNLVAYFFDSERTRIGHAIVPVRTNHSYEIPDRTDTLKWGLRVSGPGSATLRRVIHGDYSAPRPALIPSGDVMAISPIYPSYDNLYRNAFVHSRLLGYRTAGLRTELLIPHDTADSNYREFQDIDVTALDYNTLTTTLRRRSDTPLLIHNLNNRIWKAVSESGHSGPTIVWIHGFEIQPWWRRKFNFTDEEQLAAGKVASAERESFWRQLFESPPENVHFVFVSNTFAEETFEDLKVRLPACKFSVIHNPIDTDLFAYTPKTQAMRTRILSIRPYSSLVYANDLSVQAVLALSERKGFQDLEFTFYGNGPLFEETLQPIAHLRNVSIHLRFLSHSEIAAIHKKHGILLVPSRGDTQGVSRDEAMSSGLVPVTSAVGSIPEFIDANCGILCPPESAEELAEAIWKLKDDAVLFSKLSAAAADRVRRQSSHAVVISQELALIGRELETTPNEDLIY